MSSGPQLRHLITARFTGWVAAVATAVIASKTMSTISGPRAFVARLSSSTDGVFATAASSTEVVMALGRLATIAIAGYLVFLLAVGCALRVRPVGWLIALARCTTVGPARQLVARAARTGVTSGLLVALPVAAQLPAAAAPARQSLPSQPTTPTTEVTPPTSVGLLSASDPPGTATLRLLPFGEVDPRSLGAEGSDRDAAQQELPPTSSDGPMSRPAPTPTPSPSLPPSTTPGVSETPTQAAVPDAAPTPAPAAADQWTIQPGDHLWAVAEETLTDEWGRAPTDGEIATYWRMLIDHNRHRLADPDHPDLVFAGQVIDLPQTNW